MFDELRDLSQIRNVYVELEPDGLIALEDLAKEYEVKFSNLGKLQRPILAEFYYNNRDKEKYREILWEKVRRSGGTPVARYNAEYSLELDIPKELLPFYKYYTPRPASIVGIIERARSEAGLIIDVGCGNGQLLNEIARDFDASRLLGIDISPESKALLSCNGLTGTLPELFLDEIQPESAEVIFLSYFVDRDSNQKGTFDAARSVLKPGGALVLEGLFPVNPYDSHGTLYADRNTLTCGKSAFDDVRLVVKYLDIQLQEITIGERLVYSLDGFEILPSVFLIFKKEKL